MNLIQKGFLRPKFEFTVQDHALHVKRSTCTASASFEIPYAAIDSRSSEQENKGISWYITGCILIGLGLLLLSFSFAAQAGDDSVGLWLGALLAETTGLFCWAVGRRETFSHIIFYSRRTGDALLHFNQALPSPVYVQEFVEILKERIEAESDELRGYRDNWRG
jgi:hypothetical protein